MKTIVNLRPDPCQAEALVPVGSPEILCSNKVSSAHSLNDCYRLIVDANRRQIAVTDGSTTTWLGTLASTFQSVVPDATDGQWWIHTDAGPELLVTDPNTGVYELVGPLPGTDAARLSASPLPDRSFLVGATQLTGGYDRGSGYLTTTDLRALADVFYEAYYPMSASLRASGQFDQPAITAWQLLDRQGNVIFRSTPQLLSLPEGFTLRQPVTSPVVGDSIYPLLLTTSVWSPSCVLNSQAVSANWRSRIASLQIIASPAINSHFRSSLPEARLDSNQARIYMPGTSLGMEPSTVQMAAALESALLKFDAEATVIYQIDNPFTAPSEMHPACETSAGSFTSDIPGEVLSAAESLILTDISLPVQAPLLPSQIASTLSQSISRQASVATLADGSKLRSFSSSLPTPATLPAAIVLPQPDVQTLVLHCDSSATVLKFAPCGRYSLWQSSNLAASDWTPAPSVFPTNTPTLISSAPLPGEIFVTPSCAPFSPLASLKICPERILRILPPIGSAGGWNYSRRHFLLFTLRAVYALTIRPDGTSASSSVLFSQGISRRDAVAATAERIYMVSSSGSLFAVSSGRFIQIPIDFSAAAVGWNEQRRELWVTDTDGQPHIILPDRSTDIAYIRTDLRVSGFCTDFPFDMIDSNQALRGGNRETDAENMEVYWADTMIRPKFPATARQAQLQWPISAQRADLRITLNAHSHMGTPTMVSSIALDGPIRAPLVTRHYIPRFRSALTLMLSGTVTAPAKIFPPELVKI